jgi:hypothetical protein
LAALQSKEIHFMRHIPIAVCFSLCILLAGSSSHAATVTLSPAKDNTLYEIPPDSVDVSNGAGDHIFAGRNGRGFSRRAVLAFDLTDEIPSGAQILSAELILHMSRTSTGPRQVSLYRMTADWGEGSSDALGQEGRGAAAQMFDATWRHRFFDADLWEIPGGEFTGTISAVQTVGGIGDYAWTDAQMVADVQMWLDKPESNYGWIVVGDEEISGTAKRFDSRENPNTDFAPTLVVEFDADPADAEGWPEVNRGLALGHNYPNPFNPLTTIRYSISEPGHLRLEICGVRGRLVRSLLDGAVPAGTHTIQWDGRSDSGQTVASGVYFYRLSAGDRVQVRRMDMLK